MSILSDIQTLPQISFFCFLLRLPVLDIEWNTTSKIDLTGQLPIVYLLKGECWRKLAGAQSSSRQLPVLRNPISDFVFTSQFVKVFKLYIANLAIAQYWENVYKSRIKFHRGFTIHVETESYLFSKKIFLKKIISYPDLSVDQRSGYKILCKGFAHAIARWHVITRHSPTTCQQI